MSLHMMPQYGHGGRIISPSPDADCSPQGEGVAGKQRSGDHVSSPQHWWTALQQGCS
jgi:hypothetical protein